MHQTVLRYNGENLSAKKFSDMLQGVNDRKTPEEMTEKYSKGDRRTIL